jgi:regulator of protease activity HflC (stomatin/prohibitin superfamily)
MNLTNEDGSLNMRKTLITVGLFLAVVIGLGSIGKVIEVNEAGVLQVKQSVSGNLEVINTPGPYLQGFGTITSYQASQIFELSKDDNEKPISVRFSDGGTAMVSGSAQFILPTDQESLLKMHNFYRTEEALRVRALKQIFVEAVQQTAALMKSEESYSTRRSEFATLVEEQVKRGIFATEAVEAKEKDVDGNEFNDVNIVIKKNAKGERMIGKPSPLIPYNITVGQITIKDFDYDETIDSLIQKKKEAEQQKVVARANAERSKQDKISAEQKALADVAIAKGAEEVEKIKEVTRAEKEKAVAILQAEKDFQTAKLAKQTAEENAKAAEVAGRAEALVNQLKVSAGLTPQEKAEFSLRKADAVSKNLASVKLPKLMIFGGGAGNNAPTDPMAAVGLESMMRITDKLTDEK